MYSKRRFSCAVVESFDFVHIMSCCGKVPLCCRCQEEKENENSNNCWKIQAQTEYFIAVYMFECIDIHIFLIHVYINIYFRHLLGLLIASDKLI